MSTELNHIYNMDCLDGMRQMEPNTIDSIVTDPPYALTTTARWKDDTKFSQNQSDVGKRFSKGFMGKEWDGKLPGIEVWQECLRVAKPGAHMLAFGGTRTHHRLMCAIEDAGWEIRDTMGWLYGSGFPKSLNISKALDKVAGVEPVDRVPATGVGFMNTASGGTGRAENRTDGGMNETIIRLIIPEPTTDAAKQWNGWGTALKPAWEPIILCRKPLDGTVANNVQKWGVGGINIDGGRVAYQSKEDYDNLCYNYKGGLERSTPETQESWNLHGGGWKLGKGITIPDEQKGRFPANLIHDGSDEVLEPFPDSKGQCGDLRAGIPKQAYNCYGDYGQTTEMHKRNDSGSAARFFYCAKASKSERGADNKHPTVKPLALMRYLCKLITPQKGIVLDPFMGSGSTGVAAYQEGFNFTGFELEKDSFETADLRIKNAKVQGKLGEWFE